MDSIKKRNVSLPPHILHMSSKNTGKLCFSLSAVFKSFKLSFQIISRSIQNFSRIKIDSEFNIQVENILRRGERLRPRMVSTNLFHSSVGAVGRGLPGLRIVGVATGLASTGDIGA